MSLVILIGCRDLYNCYINLAILALYFVSENDLYYYSPKQELVLLYSFSLLLLQHAETTDIGTCDQSVPKAYPYKGTPLSIPRWLFYYQFCTYPFLVMWNFISVCWKFLYAFLLCIACRWWSKWQYGTSFIQWPCRCG